MGFDLFGPAKTSDIRVGYISTDRGYVPNVSICEANRYAKLNPGTTFIVKNRKRIDYKNINGVNKLKPIDVFVPREPEGECGGINLEKPYGPPKVEFFGGGGVGVKGNVVVGKGGGVLGVHIVSGGHGYQYPPIVRIKDGGDGKKGGGAVATAGIGQTVIMTEVYDAEDEFEEYFPNNAGATVEGFSIKQFCETSNNKKNVTAGRRYSPDGKDLGAWTPEIYVNTEEDPIARQIAQFQDYLATLTDPWWFTRKEAPLNVVSDNEEGFVKRQKKLNFDPNRTVYPVQHYAWGGNLATHGTKTDGAGTFENVVFDIYSEGGKGKGLQFTFTEIGGNHTFTVKADDYTDGGEPRSITKHIKPNVDYKVTSQGTYKRKGTEQGLLLKNFGSKGKEKGLGTSSIIFADLAKSSNDNDDLQILAKKGRFKSTNPRKVSGHSTYDLTYKLIVPSTKGAVSSSKNAKSSDIARSFMNDHAISPVPMSNEPGSDFAGMLFTMEWEEEFPFPGEYTFKAQCDNIAAAYLDNQPLLPTIAKWKDKPSIIKKNLNWDGDSGKVHKIRIDLLNTPIMKDLVLQEPPQADSSDVQYEEISTATAKFEGNSKDNLFLVVTGQGTANVEIKLDTNDSWSAAGLAIREMRCGPISLARTKGRKRETLTGSGSFVAGRHKIEIIGAARKAGEPRVADTRIELLDDHGSDTNAALTLKVNSVAPEKRRLKAPAKPKTAPAAGIKVQKVFNTVDWIGKANRQLWRTNVYGRGGFVNTAGICPFDTSKNLETNPYAGTHAITWRNINFPIDGNYTIKVAVDDNVNLRFHGTSGEVYIRKEGFSNRSSTGTSTYTRFFKKGNYTLDADLEQIPGGRFGFRQNGKVKDKEVTFKVTSGADYANKITIPGLFSVGKELKGSQINQSFVKNVEVGKEYDVILNNETTNRVKLRVRDNGRRLEMEDSRRGSDWNDIICTTTEGQFYGIQGNKCKFKLEETVKGINPMVLAVDVQVAYATKTVVSAKSWQENPMGVAFTIKAPLPPTPIEEIPKSKGRCPNNPMWTTRFPANNNWYPVRMDPDMAKRHEHSGKGWSEFLNRYAVSPVLPLNKPGTDHGGKIFSNSWDVNVPYDGFYQIKGEVDDVARFYVNGDLKLDLSRRQKTPEGRDKTFGTSKFFLKQGTSKIKIEVENFSFVTYKDVSKKIFSARDWRRQPPSAPPPAAKGILCHAGGGKGGTDNSEQLVGGKVIVGKGGDGGPGGDDNMHGKHHGGTGGGAGLRNGGHSSNTLSHKQIDAMGTGKYKGGPGGFGVNFQGTQVGSIEQTVTKDSNDTYSSGGDGVAMGGGGGGAVRKSSSGRGGHGGSGGVQITWGLTSKSQQWTTPGVYKVTVPGEAKSINTVSIVCIGGGGSGFKDPDGDKQGSGGSGGAYAYVTESIEAGQKLKIVVGKGGQGKNVKGGSAGGDSYVELASAPSTNEYKIIKQKKGEVSYSGPNLFHYTDNRWGKVMNKFGVSPANVDADLDKPTPDNVGTKIMEWKNVDFPLKGQYDILFAADNKAELYINGEQLLFADENYTLSSEKSYDKINIGTPGRYDVKIRLINTHHRGLEVGSPNDDVFRNNPSGVLLEIRKDVSVAVDKGKSWTKNPIGVSGILVPPPCPQEVGGKGVVTNVVVTDPGTGFEEAPPDSDDPKYPVVTVLKEILPPPTSINYDCSKDKVIMVPDLGYKFPLTCDNFGRIKKITLIPPPSIPPLTSPPQIWIESGTGVGAPPIPVFDFIIPPPDILPPEDIIQVTDLAGIKQTGYYNGKPYYGAIYYENGIKYAGWYETGGQPIQIYDTLQESIDARVTTPPSAIQRQGSDVSSNDPRLNIPGTPENLT